MRRGVIVLGSAAVTAGVVAAAALGLGGQPGTPSQRPTGAPATEPVTRTTLTQSQQVNGVLGYGATTAVAAEGNGVLTWLPQPGSTLSRGATVYRIDNLPVVLFYGSLPLYRPLRSGDTGADVREVEQNLAALGYSGITVDTKFTAATAAAVKRWQKDHGYARTGVLDPSAIVLAPGRIRVASVSAHLGDRAGGPVLAYAGTTRVVSVELDVALQSLVRKGSAAVVTLPDGSTVDGRVTAVGHVVTQTDQQHPPTIPVTVSVADQTKFSDLDQAPVVVAVVSAHADNVLTVPVVALVALAEGGYGVQVADGSATHYVAVQLGMFGQGRVEVSGDGIAEGTKVVVPS